jgi:F0F1-type ATP synthase membrane subunit b/b'
LPALETFLRRVRFPGVPGAPAAAGVPVDRATEVASELTPVFELLEEAQATARRIVAEADEQVARLRSDAGDEARRIVAAARAAAPGEGARAAANVIERSDRDRTAYLTGASRESERIDRVAAQRLPAVVGHVVSAVLAMGTPPR